MARPSLLGRVVVFFSSLLDEILADADAVGTDRTKRRSATARISSTYPLVPQDDETGCGVACIAMLASKDYEEVKAILFGSKRKRVFYTGYKDLRAGLAEFDLALEPGRPRKFTDFRSIGATAIVAVEQSPPMKSHWHWIVFVRDGRRAYVLDPSWEGILRTDLRSLQGRHFLRLAEPKSRSIKKASATKEKLVATRARGPKTRG